MRHAFALTLFIGCGSVADAATLAGIGSDTVSPEARRLAGWVGDSGDNAGLPFVIVDKTAARVFVVDSKGQLLGAASALIGIAIGDDSPPGIGDRPLAQITPMQRITPAGRFASSLGQDLARKEVLWVDYDAALSLHPVVTSNKSERRLQRLASATVQDNRISYGCINVPPGFFRNIIAPLFRPNGGIVYILPETRSLESVFFHADAKASVASAQH